MSSPEYVPARQPEIIPPGQETPIEAPRRRLRFPLTTSLMAINIGVFLLMVFTGVSAANPAPRDIVRWGANYAPFTLQGQAWRLITSVFLHIGLVHILVNMWALWNLGALAEMIFGPKFYLPIYLLAGVAGNIASLAIHHNAPGAGASGAIFGIAGAMISVLKLAPVNAPRNAMRGTLRSLLWFAVFNLLFGGSSRHRQRRPPRWLHLRTPPRCLAELVPAGQRGQPSAGTLGINRGGSCAALCWIRCCEADVFLRVDPFSCRFGVKAEFVAPKSLKIMGEKNSKKQLCSEPRLE